MLRFGSSPGQIYYADQVRTVRDELPSRNGRGRDLFPLKGERTLSAILAERARFEDGEEDGETDAQRHPENYPAEEFRELCEITAENLAKHLGQMLVDPGIEPKAGLWNIPGLWPALIALRDREAGAAGAQIVATEVTRLVADELDFARETGAFVLIEGREGIGKSEAARAWCERHPGRAVYVRLESGSDETTLYRAIARQIGTACSYGRKAVEMRARIQDALQTGQLMLVLDEAHFLWPQSDRSERTVPKRIDWLRTALIDYGVAVALVSTPQFFKKQCDRFRKAGWNSLQVQRRLARAVTLPEELSADDVVAVARQQFPAAETRQCKLIAARALATVGYLTTITHLRKRVTFLAGRRVGVAERDLISEVLNEGRAPEIVREIAPSDPLSDRKGVLSGRLSAPQGGISSSVQTSDRLSSPCLVESEATLQA